MVWGAGRRERVRAAYDEFCAAAGAALGAAERLQERAAAALAEALSELWLREAGLDRARRDPGLSRLLDNPRLAPVVDRLRSDHRSSFDRWRARSPDRLSALVADAAPGPAGQDPTEWLGRAGSVEGTGTVPAMWQLGHATLGDGDVFRLGVGLLDESHLQITSTPGTRVEAEGLVESLLTRVVSYFRPGMVAVHVWDMGQYAGALPGLYPLTRTGLLTVHDPAALDGLLGQLSDRIRRVHTRILVDGHPSLRALARSTGVRGEPWMVAVLLGNRQALGDDEHRQLQRIARGGLACGVALVLLDVPTTLGAAVETVTFTDPEPAPDGDADAPAEVRSSMTGPHLQVLPDPPLPTADVTGACTAIVDEHERWRGRLGAFADLLPDGAWGELRSANGVHAPIGFVDGLPVTAALDDGSPHALVGGPSGSGKTNLLLAWISAMAARYSPDELELYMLDFKEGVSFAQFAPGRADGRWLPQARLIGVNINTDREFGLALLQFLSQEMRRRAEAAKRYEVTKLAELREVDPHGRWPRIVAVVDEFQYLFADNDIVSREATTLLEDVARRGRSQGIHLILASQDVSGIEAFWGRPAILEQFVLRIALPRARRVLAETNDAALNLPRWHAVVNHESGIKHGNELARIPDATGREAVDKVRNETFDRIVAGHGVPPPAPVLFDGARAPHHASLAAALPTPGAGVAPSVLLGQSIDVAGSPAAVALPDTPGRNVAVIAPGAREALRVLGAATSALGTRTGPARFVLSPLVSEAAAACEDLCTELAGAGHTVERAGLDEFRARVEALAAEVTARLAGRERDPVFLVLFAADAADPVLERAGTEALRTVLHHGPETGVHVLGWWRGAQRLKALLSLTATVDDVGAWIALDVQGSELGPFAPGLPPAWSPRPGRGLFFDRAQHTRPHVVIVPEWP